MPVQTRTIRSRNADYQRFQVLKTNRNKRYRYGEFFVEGVRNLNAAVQFGWHISSLLYPAQRPLSGWAQDLLHSQPTDVNYALSPELMDELSGKADGSELMAVVRMRPDSFSQLVCGDPPLLALFDRPSNKGNLGTILRSCDALGVDGLILTGHGVDPYDPEVVASTMGSFFKVPVIRAPESEAVMGFIEEMRRRYPGFQTVGTTAHRQKPLKDTDLTLPTLFMIGNETDGLCRAFKEGCDVLATIPMDPASYASSFNVGCAATVLFYEAARQRGTF